ncbi:MAG: hypothetical protein IKV27_07570 [Lachnospiraceae bacterium]|nr:hypothetical protein [Lachnospiraceae bacterium]
MSAKTKIVVLRMKELIYTGIFVALGILLIILLIIMFLPGKETPSSSATQPNGSTGQETSLDNTTSTTQSANPSGTPASSTDVTAASTTTAYIPGIYTTELVLNDQSIDVEVIVDQSSITSVRLVNLSETITTMYPLLEPTFQNICTQVYEKQSVEGVTYETENKYTSLVLLEAIRNSLEKARSEFD